MDTASEGQPGLTRRQLLGAATAVSLGSTSGCIERVRSIVTRESPSPVSVTVSAPPADADRLATLIARHLVDNFEAVGIDASLDILQETELYRRVYFNRDFDLFVAQLPPMEDPHVLHGLTNSVFAGEPGWQNPYNFTDITVDDYLDAQRAASGEQRRVAVRDLLERLSRDQPFMTIAFPDQIRAVRTDRFTGWENYPLQDPISYLGLARSESVSPDEDLTLSLAVTDPRVSESLNPLAVEYRQLKPFTSVIYDPLARRIGDEYVPWLAADWDWEPDDEGGGDFVVTLRPGQVWHDGTSLTANDVAFTFRFLADTSLDTLSHDVPAPRFRSLTSLVEEINVVDDTSVRITVPRTSEEVGTQLLTVPLLPEHIWRDKTSVAEIQGIEGSGNVTEALAWNNADAVGSGPLAVENVSATESVTFSPFSDHFMWQDGSGLERLPEQYSGRPAFDRLELRVIPSNETAIELTSQGDLDGTATGIDPRPELIQRIIGSPDLSQLVEMATTPYQIGYNTGITPFSNPHFRRLLGRLVDKRHITESIFDGYGRPAANPFDGTHWSPEALDFGEEDPEVPFVGTDGEVDVGAARDLFREQGFEFDEDGTLILR
jgi:peptide/nickel transport system substrate-binding protein